MKPFFLTLIFCGLAFIAKSQNASVEKSTFGVQTGYLGIWAHNETKLSNSIALRSEIGLSTDIGGNVFRDRVTFLMKPAITLEPRLYYNLNKRVSKSRRIDGNSGNFISLSMGYKPDWFAISNIDNVSVISEISIIPNWGIRRSIGEYFTFEAGIGIGYWFALSEQSGSRENGSGVILNLPLRIGYRF